MFEGRDWWAAKAAGRQVPVPADAARMLAPPGLLQWMAALVPPPPPPPAEAADMQALLAEAETRGWQAGAAAARAEAEAALAPERQALAAAVAAFAAAHSVDPGELAPALAQLVRQLCEAVLLAELARPQALLPLAEAALGLLADDGPAELVAHPDVLAALAPALPPALATRADAALPPGQLQVRAPALVVAADAGARLAALVAAHLA